MQLPAQDFLRLTELAGTLGFLDIESTGLRGDYNSVLVASLKPFGESPESFFVEQPGNDQGVVTKIKHRLEQCDCWVTYYGKGFDIPMLNTRLLRWHKKPIEKRPHLDLYFALKYNLLTARKSQGHLLSWLEGPEQKMTVGAEVWNRILANPQKEIRRMIARCESDVEGLESLYRRTKHVVNDVKR